MNIDTFLTSTGSGLVSGLFVAFTVSAVSRSSHRRFELRKTGNDNHGVLLNRGWYPVLLGNSMFLGDTGELRQASEPDSPISGVYLRPNDSLVVNLGNRPPGSTVFLTYRPLLRRPRRPKEIKLAEEAKNIGPFLFKSNRIRRWKEYAVSVSF